MSDHRPTPAPFDRRVCHGCGKPIKQTSKGGYRHILQEVRNG